MKGSVGIIGGGLGGLATAVALSRAGWRTQVFERAAHPDRAGTALGMWPAALHALDALGLGRRARDIGTPQLGGALLRPDGTRLGQVDLAALSRRTGDTIHLLSRPALLELLHGALPAGTVQFGTEVTDPTAVRATYDVVVIADGIFSRTRAAIFGPATGPRYAGSTAWRGTVDGNVDAAIETWGPGLRFGITPREDGRTNWYATRVTAEGGRSPEGELTALKSHFGEWHEGVRRVLDTLRADEILRHDLYDLDPPLPTYVRDTVAVIGDAAHAMTPDLGRGACEALIDGVTLARCLDAAARPCDGLAAYDRLRRRPTQQLVRMSRTMGRLASVRRFTLLRDLGVRAALRLSPPG